MENIENHMNTEELGRRDGDVDIGDESLPAKQAYTRINVIRDQVLVRSNTLPPGILIPPRISSQRKIRRSASTRDDSGDAALHRPTRAGLKQRPSQRSRRTTARKFSKDVFELLPPEIYHCVLDHIEASHSIECFVDVAGLQFDLRSCCLVSRRWSGFARERLYRDVWLPSAPSPRKYTFGLTRANSRLALLLRTLRRESKLAGLVRRLRVTPGLRAELVKIRRFSGRRSSSLDLLRDIVELCPELQQVDGFLPEMTRPHADYFETLFGKRRLKAHVWWMRASSSALFGADRLIQGQNDWRLLEMLILCRDMSQGTIGIGPGIVIALVHRLPSLKHLMVDGLAREDFHNGTLLGLPAVKSLRLGRLDGITDQGIQQLAHSRLTFSLESLTLHGLELTSLWTIHSILASCARLRRFKLIQTTALGCPTGPETARRRCPLASSSLQHLHWETLFPDDAQGLLARSVLQGGFPALRTVKAPCDYDGQLQAVCRPIGKQRLTVDDMAFVQCMRAAQGYSHSLRLARLQAQLRIRESRQRPSFNVVVRDEDEVVRRTHVFGAYIGVLDSLVEYSLESDVPGGVEALAALSDVTGAAVKDRLVSEAPGATRPGTYQPAIDYGVLF